MAKAPWTAEASGKLWQYEITKAEVAERAGLSRVYVTRLFTGERNSKDAIEKVIKTIDEIVEEKRNAEGEVK